MTLIATSAFALSGGADPTSSSASAPTPHAVAPRPSDGQSIQLAGTPALSPDGSRIAFSWRGDIWTADSNGGVATALTRHTGGDSLPKFSPDGSEIAFVSTRTGSSQIFRIPAEGGSPTQVTHDTGGYRLEGWYPDGESLLVNASRDHFWRRPERFFEVSLGARQADRLLFDAYGREGWISPDESQLLFTREGVSWWRKGYHGSQASQIWHADLQSGEMKLLLGSDGGNRTPIWKPDQTGFYYVGSESGSFNLWSYDLATGKSKQLTKFEDDSVVSPSISADGSTLVFRHLFHIYRMDLEVGSPPRRVNFEVVGDEAVDPVLRRNLDSASDVAFTQDGLEIAFIAGGDLWVMDTELREPIQVTNTPEDESSPLFTAEGDALIFVSDQGGQSDIWRAERGDAERYWWLNDEFNLTRLTEDADIESNLSFSPDGETLAYSRGRGGLWTMDPDGKSQRELFPGWNMPDITWSPDGAWIAYAVQDDEFNSDIWIRKADGSDEPQNVSKHPDRDGGPVWSPDGKRLAWTGRRSDDEYDVYWVNLVRADNEEGSRDRELERALEKMKKNRKEEGGKKKSEDAKDDAPDSEEEGDAESEDEAEADEPMAIDFEDIHERIRRISVPNSFEGGLLWSPDSKKLAFRASVDGKSGLYTVEFPESLSPKFLTTSTLGSAVWLEKGNQIVGLDGGSPASMTASGKSTRYSFRARQALDRAARLRAGFDVAWRLMRDGFYDGRHNNRNWDAVRRKYRDVAGQVPDDTSFGTVVSMMLGELNGSHLGFRGGGGFRGGSGGSSDGWTDETAHLGLRFDSSWNGPGLKVRDVILGGPTDKVASRVDAGEVILSIDGTSVDPALDLTTVLNGRLDRDIRLVVQGADGESRDVDVRPISQRAARSLLYPMWTRANRKAVDEASNGTLGYLHIRGMNWTSFLQFEEELYAVGAGKEGIVIDVRENGGGSTADHLLTALTQPVHAITVPRGGGQGYPQDRKVYASWHKPIVVMCNQNSFSNAEIFAHAVKHLERGQVVGVTTAGGVISTGSARVMDLGTLRMPFRGWYLAGDGEDMEHNGCVPHHELWPHPGELPMGVDRQLDKAVEVLLQDVATEKAMPKPALRKASER